MSLIYQGTKAIIKQVKICKKNINEDIQLGRGGQAVVYKGVLVIQQQDLSERSLDIALKRIQLPKVSLARKRIYELIKREQSVYRSIKSPHIIKLYGTNLNYQNTKLEDLEYLDFYFELCDGNLADLIIDVETRTDVPLSEQSALKIFSQIVEVELLLEQSIFLRSSNVKQGLFHRDMNIKNILFKKKKNKIDVKVCDFGMANYIEEEINLTQNIGTATFVSPENKFLQQYSFEKNETWSLGILLFCLLKGLLYYKNNISVFNKDNDHYKLIEKMECFDYTKEILKGLLHYDPDERWGYEKIEESQWYKLFCQNKYKCLENIQPILKFRKDLFQNLSLHLIKYNNFINQNKPLLSEFEIPQDLLLITLRSYQLWSWKQLEKYSGSYCYEYNYQDKIEDQKVHKLDIKKIEANLIQITQELREFFLYVQQNNFQNQEIKNEDYKQIIVYWSSIINKTANISHFRPDVLYYQTKLLEDIEKKLLSHLSLFLIQTDQNVITQKLKDSNKIINQISKLKLLSQSFEQILKKQTLELEQLEQQAKSLEQLQIKIFQGQVSIKKLVDTQKERAFQEKLDQVSKYQNQDDNTLNKNLIEQREKVKELKYQFDECSVAIKQKEKLLQILKQKEILETTLQILQQIQDQFKLFFDWKNQQQYIKILESQKKQ